MDLHHLRSLVLPDYTAVNTLIHEKIHTHISTLDNLANHIIESGGKRLRPLLVLLASRACNYQGQDHILLAAGLEFFHTATLLHDDVIDESSLRRGRKTANEIWGSKASILVGDFLFTQYMQLMIDVGDLKIMQLLTDISLEIGCGELKQMDNRHNFALSLEDYLDVIKAKTSLLFAAGASLGALVSKSPDTIQQALYDYGLHLGNAFQLIDDALDYCSDAKTMGKNVGDDLADGKATLPLLHALKHGSEAQKQLIKTSLTEGSLAQLPAILDAIASTKAIEYTHSVAEDEVKKALSALQALPDSVYKEALKDLAQYAIARNY